MQIQKKPFNYLNLIFVLLALATYVYIFRRLIRFDNWQSFTILFDHILRSGILLAALFVFWVVNLSTEVKKWQLLMRPYYCISFKAGLQQILAGTVTAILSPGRIAEPGGRMSLLPPNTEEQHCSPPHWEVFFRPPSSLSLAYSVFPTRATQ